MPKIGPLLKKYMEQGEWQDEWSKRAFFERDQFKSDLNAWIKSTPKMTYAKLGRITGQRDRLRYYLSKRKANNLGFVEIALICAYVGFDFNSYMLVEVWHRREKKTIRFDLNGTMRMSKNGG